MNRAHTTLVSLFAGLAIASPLWARPVPDSPPPPPPPVTVQADVSSTLPMGPKGQPVTITGHIGAVIGQSGPEGATNLPLAAGLDISSPAAPPKGTRLQCINIVEKDSQQGWRWKEAGKEVYHLAPTGSPRIDPLPGGNIAPSAFREEGTCDYEIFWEPAMTGRNLTPAAWIGNLSGFAFLDLASAFASGASMEIAFADRATWAEKLTCVTLFVLVDEKGRRIGVIGGFRWGVDKAGNHTATAPFSGLDGFTPQQLDKIARDSGYTRWRFVPTPGSAALLGLAMMLTLPRSTRGPRATGSAAPANPPAAEAAPEPR